MKVRFIRRFDWVVRKEPRVVRVYKPGMVITVTKRCADAAKAKGAIEVEHGSTDQDSGRAS
jgi:hypothetical protein